MRVSSFGFVIGFDTGETVIDAGFEVVESL